jgi:hypothetical protein
MPRLLLALLLVAPAVAAPVPKAAVLTPEQTAEFDRLWEASLNDTAVRVHFACRCFTHKDAAGEYLSKRLKPFAMTEAEAKEWLKKLGSDDEAEWTAAYRTLRVYDVRLAMTLPDALEHTSAAGQSRLGGIVYHTAWSHSPEGAEQFDRYGYQLKPHEGGRQWVSNKIVNGRETGGMGTFPDLGGWAEHNPNAFDRQRMKFAQHLLARLGTPVALETLDRMTTGNPVAWPTKDAKEVVARLKTKQPADSQLVSRMHIAQAWERPHQVTNVPAVVAAAVADPDAVPWLRARLTPLKLGEKRARELVKALFSDDAAVWQPAFKELKRLDFRLALPFADVWAEATTADQRVRLKWLLAGERDEFDGYRDYVLKEYTPGEVKGWYLDRKVRDGIDKGQLPPGFTLGYGVGVQLEVTDMKAWWTREESAVYILDAIGTDDAVAVIKEMATGHPDAGPTKAAKEVLKRRGVK